MIRPRLNHIVLAFAFALATAPLAARATSFYVGEGEDEFAGDIDAALGAVSPWMGTTSHKNDTGAISTDLNGTLAQMGAGDVLIFHYAGHGSPIEDVEHDPEDPPVDTVDPAVAHADLQIGTADDQLAGNGLRDNDLTSIFAAFPVGATALVVLDACHSGLAIHDGAVSGQPDDLGTVPIDFIATADKDHCAPGNSLFLPLLVDAFKLQGGMFKADANNDGYLTENELFDYTSNFSDPDSGGPVCKTRTPTATS